MRGATDLAAGVASLPSTATAFAATQASWRFLNNERVSLPALAGPLREVGRSRTNATEANVVLLVHDWCKLTYRKGKRDIVQLTHETDVGYELTTALLVSGADGSPLAPMEMHLKTAGRILSTRSRTPADVPHLEQVLPTMRASLSWGLNKPILHVIDREADSVDHYRRWNAAGHKYLVRGDDRRVEWNGKSMLLSGIRTALRRAGKFRHVGEAAHQGHPAKLYVAETEVVLKRPAKKSCRGKKFELDPDAPLDARHLGPHLHPQLGVQVAQWLVHQEHRGLAHDGPAHGDPLALAAG